jgi:hypothetical protein
MKRDKLAVTRGVNIRFYVSITKIDRIVKSAKRVLGRSRSSSAMRERNGFCGVEIWVAYDH